MPTPFASLDYSRGTRPFNRHPARLALVATLVLLVTLVAYDHYPAAHHAVSLYLAQRACLTHTPPPDQVVYDSTGQRSFGRVSRGGPFLPYLVQRNPTGLTSDFAAAAVPFLHARIAPGAAGPSLVIVRFDNHHRFVASTEPSFTPFNLPSPADRTCFQPVGVLPIYVYSTDRLLIRAGTPDPSDPAHFTIPLTINDVPYTIDGRLAPSGSVLLTPAPGPNTPATPRSFWSPPHFDPDGKRDPWLY